MLAGLDGGRINPDPNVRFDQTASATGALDEIMRVHSLHPAGLDAHLRLYGAVMRGTPSLRKVERELLALVVSGLNGCHY